MTVAAAPRKILFPGAGLTTPYTFNFRTLLHDDGVQPYITVTRYSVAGDPTVLNYPGDYTFVPLNAGLSGGTITTAVAVTVGQQLLVQGATPVDQGIKYSNEGNFFPEKHELSYDKLTMIVQESAANIANAIQLDPASTAAVPILNTPVPGGLLAYNNDGTRIVTGSFAPWVLPDGTAAAPSFYFQLDTDTGIYRPASNTLGIAIGGSTGFTVGNYAGSGTAVNYLGVLNVGTGFFPVLQAFGTDPNLSILYVAKGTGGHAFNTGGPTNNGITQFTVAHTATAVNYIQVTGSVASSSPSIQAQGSDVDVSLKIRSQGIGTIDFCSGSSNSNVNFRVFAGTSPVVNYAFVQGAPTGSAVQFGVLGTDTNISAGISSKGVGSFGIYSGSFGRQIAGFFDTPNSVNYWGFLGAATGGRVVMVPVGTDLNIGTSYYSKGTSGHQFYTAAGADLQFAIASNASAVNYLQVNGNVAGSGPSLTVQGSDANADLNLHSKGTGSIFPRTNGAIRGQIDGNGNWVVGINTLATNATAGFLWVTSSAGAPTGAATAPSTGACALHYDATNNKIYVRSGGTWRSTIALT